MGSMPRFASGPSFRSPASALAAGAAAERVRVAGSGPPSPPEWPRPQRVLLFVLLRSPVEPTATPPIAAAADSAQLPTLRPMVEEVLGASLSPAEYELLVTDDVTAEALVIAAVDAR